MLIAAALLVLVQVICWLLLLNDTHTSMAYSSSFCILGPTASQIVISIALLAAPAGTILSTLHIARRSAKRLLVILVLVFCSLSTLTGILLDAYITNNTDSAVLKDSHK